MARNSFAHVCTLVGLASHCDAFRNEANGGSVLDVRADQRSMGVDCIQSCWTTSKEICDIDSMLNDATTQNLESDLCATDSATCKCTQATGVPGATQAVTECDRIHLEANQDMKIHIGGEFHTKLSVHERSGNAGYDVKWCLWDDSAFTCNVIGSSDESGLFSVDITPKEVTTVKKWEIRMNGDILSNEERTHTETTVSTDATQLSLGPVNRQVCLSDCQTYDTVESSSAMSWSFGLTLTDVSPKQCIECTGQHELYVEDSKLRLKLAGFTPEQWVFYPQIENNKAYKITLGYSRTDKVMVLFIDGQTMEEAQFQVVPDAFSWTDPSLGCAQDGTLPVQGHVSQFHSFIGEVGDWQDDYSAKRQITDAAVSDFKDEANAEQVACSAYNDCVIEEKRILEEDMCHHTDATTSAAELTTRAELTNFHCDMLLNPGAAIDDCLRELNKWESDTKTMMGEIQTAFGTCHQEESNFRNKHIECSEKERTCERKRCVSGQKLVETFYAFSYNGPFQSELLPAVADISNPDLVLGQDDIANFNFGSWARPVVDDNSALPITHRDEITNKFESTGYQKSTVTSAIDFWLTSNAFTELTSC